MITFIVGTCLFIGIIILTWLVFRSCRNTRILPNKINI